MKDKVNLTLTKEARAMLRQIADDNGLKMSQVLELLIRGNVGIKFTVKGGK